MAHLSFNRPSRSAAQSRSIKTWLTLGLAASLTTVVGCTAQPQAQQSTSAQSPVEAQTAQQPDAANGAEASARTLDNVQIAPGSDPMAMVLATRQPSTEPIGSEQIRLSYPSEDKAVVVVTKTGLPDDSVAATRTRYEFIPVAGSTGETQWQLSRATEQNKCQAQRGSQDWTGELCK